MEKAQEEVEISDMESKAQLREKSPLDDEGGVSDEERQSEIKEDVEVEKHPMVSAVKIFVHHPSVTEEDEQRDESSGESAEEAVVFEGPKRKQQRLK